MTVPGRLQQSPLETIREQLETDSPSQTLSLSQYYAFFVQHNRHYAQSVSILHVVYALLPRDVILPAIVSLWIRVLVRVMIDSFAMVR